MRFIIATPQEFDAALKLLHERDEHELMESRFYDAANQVFAKVVRHADENGELLPHADLMIREL